MGLTYRAPVDDMLFCMRELADYVPAVVVSAADCIAALADVRAFEVDSRALLRRFCALLRSLPDVFPFANAATIWQLKPTDETTCVHSIAGMCRVAGGLP